MENEKKPAMIGSLQIGIGIVDLIANQQQPLKFTEIQELTQITKSNLYKYLNTLTHLELLYRDKKNGTYSLGPKMIAYGMAAIGQQDLITKATPYLQELNQATNLTALLAVWTNDGPVIASISSANIGLNIGAQIGTRLPILSSSGKVFSTFQTPLSLSEWKDHELKSLSPKQIENLQKEENKIRKTYISFAKEPLVSYVSSASAPLFNYNKELVGCLTIVGFSENVPQRLEDDHSKTLLKLAKEISGLFGFKEFV